MTDEEDSKEMLRFPEELMYCLSHRKRFWTDFLATSWYLSLCDMSEMIVFTHSTFLILK